MGDKPLQAQNAINFLNSRTKTQLHFAGIEDRVDLIAQARKYIIKDRLLKDMTAKSNYLLRRVADFKIIFKDIFEQGFPNFWVEQHLFIWENDYQAKLLDKRNDIPDIDKSTSNIKGKDIFDILENDLYLLFMMRQTINGLPLVTYSFYSELDAISREMLAVPFPANPIWKRITMFANKWTNVENYSSALVPVSQFSRTWMNFLRQSLEKDICIFEWTQHVSHGNRVMIKIITMISSIIFYSTNNSF